MGYTSEIIMNSPLFFSWSRRLLMPTSLCSCVLRACCLWPKEPLGASLVEPVSPPGVSAVVTKDPSGTPPVTSIERVDFEGEMLKFTVLFASKFLLDFVVFIAVGETLGGREVIFSRSIGLEVLDDLCLFDGCNVLVVVLYLSLLILGTSVRYEIWIIDYCLILAIDIFWQKINIWMKHLIL